MRVREAATARAHHRVDPRVVLLVAVATASGMVACGNDEPPPASEGALIRALGPTCSAVRTASTPTVRVGEAAEAPAHPSTAPQSDSSEPPWFERIVGGRLLPDGGFVIAEAGDQTLRFFDGAGNPTATLGGRGEGPGEMTAMSSIHVVDGDVLAWEASKGRWTRFPTVGEPTTGRTEPELARTSLAGVLDGGRLVFSRTHGGTAGGAWRDTLEVVLATPESDSTSVPGDRIPGTERFADFSRGMSVFGLPFGRTATVDVWPERGVVVVANGDSAYVRLMDRDGNRLGTVATPWPRTGVTDDMRASWRSAETLQAELVDPGLLPEVTAPYGRVVADRAGYVWVEEPTVFGADSVAWAVLDSSGREVERVRLGARDRLLDVDGRAALVQRLSALDVPGVVLFERSCTR